MKVIINHLLNIDDYFKYLLKNYVNNFDDFIIRLVQLSMIIKLHILYPLCYFFYINKYYNIITKLNINPNFRTYEKLMGHIFVYFIFFILSIFTDNLFIQILIHTNLISNFTHYLNNNLIS